MAKRILTPLLLLLFVALHAQQEESEPIFNLEVVADTYFKTGINSTNSIKTTRNTPPTSFADKPGFALGMVNAIARFEAKNIKIVADVVEGPRGRAASDSPINQLYAKYRPAPNFELTFGKFNTFLGYELISPKDDFNYSTSYLFSNGPFSHTGLKGRYYINDNQSVMMAFMNSSDDTKFNSTNSYTLGFQYNFHNQNINLIYGDRDTDPNTGSTFEVDYTGGGDITDKFFLGVNAAYETTNDAKIDDAYGFYGIALYALFKVRENVKLGIRPEYFTKYTGDQKSVSTATTLSANIALSENLVLIPELRWDHNKDKPFVNRKLQPQEGLVFFLVGVVYHFDKDL